MHRMLSCLGAAAAIGAFAALSVPAARAADAPVDTHAQAVTPATPDPRIWQTAPTPQGPTAGTQRETASVRGMSGLVLRNAGADHPGEDQLGTGTSITH